MRSSWLRDKALPLAAWAVVLFLHIPLALIILYAFSAEDKSYVFPPPALTLQWFAVAWGRDDVWAAIRLSFSVAAFSTAIALVLGTLAAAALARARFFGRDVISLLLVLPIALPGILTGTILGLAVALGDTAPLLLIGMVAFVDNYPSLPIEGFMDPATALPVQVYSWATRSDPSFIERSNGAIIVLLGFLITMNVAAVLLRRKFERRW